MILEYETLLSDVSRLFASPLPWSCNASSNDAERIIIEETGALLAVYVGEIPIHLTNKNTLSDERLDRVALLLANLLLNLEELVNDDIPLCTTSTTEVAGMFPKLNALRLSIQREPSIDTCARYISLHQQPIKFKATRRRISSILEDIKRTTGDRHAESAVLPPMDAPITPVQFHESFYTCAIGVFGAFQHHLKVCEPRRSNHKAFLHLKGSPNSGMKDQGDRVDILLAICSLQEAWQEVRCAFMGCKPLSTPPGEPGCIRSICEVARETHEFAGVVEVHVCKQQIFNMSIEEAGTSYSNADPAITLSNLIEMGLLANRYKFPEKHKLVLAFNLAQSLLQFYCSQWIQKDWTAEELYFLYETDKNKVHNIHQPYICCFFDGRTYKPDIEDSWHRYPFILTFGKLLFEIAEGRPIVVENSKDGRFGLLRTLNLRFEKRCKDYFSTDYCRAILGCLKFQKRLQELTVGDELMKCRRVIQKEIVEPLGREVARFNNAAPGSQDLDLNETFSLGTANSQKQTARSKDLDSLEHTCSYFSKVPRLPIKLLQFSDYSVPSSEEKKNFARSFLKRFEEFRTHHVSRSEHVSRVKIAILDTGLNLNDPSIRGLRRVIESRERSREINSYKNPIRETRNFTAESDADAEGHGTRVAGLLLTVAPEADVYVGKISHRMTTEVSDRTILKAFQWAVVDIGADIVSRLANK